MPNFLIRERSVLGGRFRIDAVPPGPSNFGVSHGCAVAPNIGVDCMNTDPKAARNEMPVFVISANMV